MANQLDYRAMYQGNDHAHVVVDLSDHQNKLLAGEDISDDLTLDQEARLADFMKACFEMSHRQISKRYPYWDRADEAYDVYVRPDATAFREKAVIADTRAVMDTVLTYLMSALFGRNPIFQLFGLDRNSRKAAKITERVFHQHMRRSAGEARLAQHLIDNIRYGMAPTKIIWSPKDRMNDIQNVSPRRAFPDPRVTWGDHQKAQFIGFTDYAAFDSLLMCGLYPKLAKYPALRQRMSPPRGSWAAHRTQHPEGQGHSIDPADSTVASAYSSSFSLGAARVVDEMYFALPGYAVGLPDYSMIYLLATIIDESVAIRLQANPYGTLFPTTLGGFYSDSHKTFSQSLADIVMPLHDIATWLLRSRIDNVQAALSNMIFADPTQVAIGDLINRHPSGIIRTLPGAKPGEGVYIANVPDVTGGHWNDIAALGELKQRISAASDAQQGMPTSDGIRSATEIQRLTQLGSQRLGVLARIMSANSIRPMARMMVENIQDFLSEGGSVPLSRDDTAQELLPDIDDGYLDYSQADIFGDVEYLVVDGTLPVEPTRSPETWLNMIQVANQTGLGMELDLKRMAERAIEAMGEPDLDQFRISKEKAAQGMTPSQQMMLMEKMRGASVQPQGDVAREVQRGNLVPISQAPQRGAA